MNVFFITFFYLNSFCMKIQKMIERDWLLSSSQLNCSFFATTTKPKTCYKYFLLSIHRFPPCFSSPIFYSNSPKYGKCLSSFIFYSRASCVYCVCVCECERKILSTTNFSKKMRRHIAIRHMHEWIFRVFFISFVLEGNIIYNNFNFITVVMLILSNFTVFKSSKKWWSRLFFIKWRLSSQSWQRDDTWLHTRAEEVINMNWSTMFIRIR
jgi:hypothetical protein